MISYNFKNNLETNDNKNFSPVYKILYTDTPFSVKSSGISLKRYTYDNTTNVPDFTNFTNITLVDSLVTNTVGFYSDDGAMIGFHQTDNFALHYSGYFYTDHPASDGNQFYYFKAFGFGKLIFSLTRYSTGSATRNYLLCDLFTTGANYYSTLSKNNTNGTTNRGVSLSPNTWYKIDVYYYTTLGDAGFTLLWANNYYGLENYIPMSAGSCSTTASFKTATTLEDVMSVERNDESNGISSLTFSVPLVASGSSNDGYYYNTFWNKYCHSVHPVAFNKFKMIEFQAGYRPSTYPTDTDDLITKFIGHIESIKTVRTKSNEHIEVSCIGFENLFKQALNLNYPNIYDYWNAGYIGKAVSDFNPDGVGCPQTFDGWELHEAYKSLCIRAGIDPTLFLKKYRYFNANEVVISGTWLIEETSPQNVTLDTSLNYGNSEVVNINIGSIADDEYILKSNFGDTLYDYINNITDVYGWQWGCNAYYNGAPYLKSNNNPYMIKFTTHSSTTIGGTGWSKQTDLNTVGGVYYQTNDGTTTNYIAIPFTGSKLDLVIVGSNDSGHEYTTVSSASNLLSMVTDSTNELQIGNIIIIETIYGEISATVTNVSGYTISFGVALSHLPKKGGYVRVATFSAEIRRGTEWTTATSVQTTYHSCYFENNYDRLILPVGNRDMTPTGISSERFYYDGIDPVTSVNPCRINIFNSLPYDNYIITVTRLTTAQAGVTNYMRIDSILIYANNTNSIIRTYYTGDSVNDGTVVALDVIDSGVDLRNDTIVVGRRLGTEVPGNDGDKALNPNNPSYEFIISRAVDTGSIYDPNTVNYVGMPRQTIQIAPEIASYDRAKYWATTFINRYRNPGKQPEFEIIGDPLIEKGDCIAIYDEGKGTVDTYNKFWITNISDSYERNKYLSKITTTTYEPWESYSSRLNPNIADYGNEPIINISINTSIGSWDISSDGISYYDPYSFDDLGNKIVIKYDLVVDAYVRVDIFSVEIPDTIISSLLNPTGSNGPEGWMRQDVGKNYVVTWDGVDMYGSWNKYCGTTTETIGKNYYATESNTLEGTNIYTYGKFKVRFTIIRRQSNTVSIRWSDKILLGNAGYIYTRRANISSIDVSCSPKNSLCNLDTISNFIPVPCYSDSQEYLNTSMTALINITDTSNKNSRNIFGIHTTEREKYLENRKIQLNISITPYILLFGSWNGRTSVEFKQKTTIPICDITSFNKYIDFSRYFNMCQLGYNYDNYIDYVGSTWVNNIINGNGLIYMAIYLNIEIKAIDKSGRLCYIQAPTTIMDKTQKTPSNRFWLMWVDDINPKPMGAGRNYKWAFIFTEGYDILKVLNNDGVDILSGGRRTWDRRTWENQVVSTSAVYGLNPLSNSKYIPVVQVYPKVDTGGVAWGY